MQKKYFIEPFFKVTFLEILNVWERMVKTLNSRKKLTLHLNFRTNFQTNWYKAQAYCHSIGRQLISISSKEEYDGIVKEIKDAGKLFY